MTYRMSDADRDTFHRIEDTNDTQGLAWRVEQLVARELADERAAWQAATGDPTPDHAKATTSDIAASMNELARQRDVAEAKVAAVEALARTTIDGTVYGQTVPLPLIWAADLRAALGEARP